MKTLFFDCNMGVAGDMFMAALYELLDQEQQREFCKTMNQLGLPGVVITPETIAHCGIYGTHMKVEVAGVEEESMDVHDHHHDHDHHHNHDHHHGHELHHHHHHEHASFLSIKERIEGMNVSEDVKKNAIAIYERIAMAESKAHRKPIEEVHFHEVGSMDAVADIVGACILVEQLRSERIVSSAIHTGYGQVRCAHGILPVPAPATADLLMGVPSSAGSVEGELCTPTGAAILTHFANAYGNCPEMTIQKIGYGMGKKEFPVANCLRVFLGETKTEHNVTKPSGSIVELNCNLDDMTPEAIGYAMEVLMNEGALDVFTTPIGMKKNRPGILFVCICKPEDSEKMANLMLIHTTTLGVRRVDCSRYTLKRSIKEVQTRLGLVHVKESTLPNGMIRSKVEYDDLVRIAKETGNSLESIREIIRKEIEE